MPDENYQSIGKRMTDLELRVSALEAQARRGPNAMASANDLDGPFGDPAVRKDPPKWTGPSFAGKKFSECSPDYLDGLASFFEWQAKKDDAQTQPDGSIGLKDNQGRLRSVFKRKDASRARGWALRIRSGWQPKTGIPIATGLAVPRANDNIFDFGDTGTDDEIPF